VSPFPSFFLLPYAVEQLTPFLSLRKHEVSPFLAHPILSPPAARHARTSFLPVKITYVPSPYSLEKGTFVSALCTLRTVLLHRPEPSHPHLLFPRTEVVEPPLPRRGFDPPPSFPFPSWTNASPRSPLSLLPPGRGSVPPFRSTEKRFSIPNRKDLDSKIQSTNYPQPIKPQKN